MTERIKLVRKRFNLTQAEFGERIGVKGNTVTGYETGIRTPSEAILLSICREFGVDETWLEIPSRRRPGMRSWAHFSEACFPMSLDSSSGCCRFCPG